MDRTQKLGQDDAQFSPNHRPVGLRRTSRDQTRYR